MELDSGVETPPETRTEPSQQIISGLGTRPKIQNSSLNSVDIYAAGPSTSRDQVHGTTYTKEDTVRVRPSNGLRPPDFQHGLDSKYLCALGNHPLKSPVQSFCGHRFCFVCKEQLLKENDNPVCPKCMEEEGEGETTFSSLTEKSVFPDRAIEREMGNLDVTCAMSDCSWAGRYRDYQTHGLNCNFQEEPCSFGCERSIKRTEIDSHNKKNVPEHLYLMLSQVAGLGVELSKSTDTNENELKELGDRIDGVDSTVSIFQERLKTEHSPMVGFHKHGCVIKNEQLDQLEKNHETNQSIVTVLSREVEQLNVSSADYDTQQKIDNDLIDSMQKKIKQLERTMALKDLSLNENEQRLRGLEMTSHAGSIVWPIKNYTEVKREAAGGRSHSIYSPPFYSSRSGYKLCARIYLNGDGVGKNSHISLFLVLMRGPYDAILQWPFNLKVTMMLLNQNKREHIIDAFRPDPTSTSFRRPLSDMNIASGCPMFASHTKVEDKKQGYIKDDTLFIKIIVEPIP